ncbi:MAG: arsenate reductase (glutaredoxin) [Verrucomicrobia bacterium]|nr:MAG: arsenate reductase (glutaredoxin) [Verrucomicrobiota bacterium]
MSTKIYYNPRCSKCRQTLTLIRKRGIEPTIIAYLETPPSKRALGDIIRKLGSDPIELIRFKEPAAKKLGLGRKDERSKAEWIEVLTKNPELLERPIVVRGDRAVLCRPPENVLAIL